MTFTQRVSALRLLRAVLCAVLCVGAVGATSTAMAANHREAPITAIDTKADITDWFAFVSYDDPTKVTMILNVDPFLEPSNGPNYFPFDPEILYEMKVDNNFDCREDITIQFRFGRPEIRLPGVFTGFVGAGGGIPRRPIRRRRSHPGPRSFRRRSRALDGPGSEGLGLRQTYTVTILKKIGTTWTTVFSSGPPAVRGARQRRPAHHAQLRQAGQQGIYNLGGGIKVFAGTVDDPFYIDLGGAFDSLNFRAGASGRRSGVLSNAQDATTPATSLPTRCPASTSTRSRSRCRSRC